MKIKSVKLSVFEAVSNTSRFDLEIVERGAWRRWIPSRRKQTLGSIHVMHVLTDEGIEGVCTIGDARYTTFALEDLEQLRILAVGEDPFDRVRLNVKLETATRGMFTRPGWFGAFDNCLWDIAGKAAGLPVYRLLGRARGSAPAYYNFGGKTKEASVDDAQKAVGMGFPAVKDHFHGAGKENIEWFRAARAAVGPDIDLLHDAASCTYSFEEAVRVGRALEELEFLWFEEPLADRDQPALQRLCDTLDVPVCAPETLMHDVKLSAVWLISGATDLLRANARHGTSSVMKLAHLAELHGSTIELNGPGGLFGLVHTHLVCAIQNTSYYEYFPNGSRDEAGKEIGLTNPPVPSEGRISPPDAPGWGTVWDRPYFEKKRVAEL